MKEDDDILAELTAQFPFLLDKSRIQRARRIFVDVPAAQFSAVFTHLHQNMQFSMLTAITGLDTGTTLTAIYHLARLSGVVLNLSVAVPKDRPVLSTVTGYFPAADAYERELEDMLGIVVEGLPEGFRYPLPDGWPEGQYPLRKDWQPEMLDVPLTTATPAKTTPTAPPADPVYPHPLQEAKHA